MAKKKKEKPTHEKVDRTFGVSLACGRGGYHEGEPDHQWFLRLQEDNLTGPVLLELKIDPDELSNLLGSRPLVIKGFTWEQVDG